MHVCGTLKPVRKLYGISFKTRFKHVDISVSIYRVNWSMALYAKEIELTGNADGTSQMCIRDSTFQIELT